MAKQQLYIKNEKGRYEEYNEPYYDDNKLYIKRGKKYIPWGMELKSNTLPEGVWIVSHRRSAWSHASDKYLKDIYTIDKCSNLEGLSLAQLGNIHKYCEEAFFDLLLDGLSKVEAFEKRVGYVISKLIEDSKEHVKKE